jgi:hypothetical protein
VTDKHDLLVHWCRAALAASPGIYQTMIDFVAARSLPYPAVMTAEQQRLINSPYLLQHQHGWKYAHMDAEMIRAILTALAEWDPMWVEAALDKLVENAALGREWVSLLNPYYDAEPLRRPVPELIPTPDMTGWGIYRAVWPESKFCFVLADSTDITLDINARLVIPAAGDSQAELLVNGKRVGEIVLGLSWQRQEVVVDGRYIQRGLNELAVRWPFPVVDKEVVWREIIGRLEKGLEANLHPIFSEIARLRIQKAEV